MQRKALYTGRGPLDFTDVTDNNKYAPNVSLVWLNVKRK